MSGSYGRGKIGNRSRRGESTLSTNPKECYGKMQKHLLFFECPLTLDILRNTLNRVSKLKIIDHKGITWFKVGKDDTERGSSISLF